ncbi:MAG: TIGR04076 family protein [Candidatus Heimdallarchaeaceae archaeon]
MTEQKKVTIEIVDILLTGKCNFGHKIGEKFDYPTETGKMCTAALHSIYPYAVGIKSGGSFSWEEDPNSVTVCCPDYKNPVVFKITREK